jgi:HK97 family phage major capsid protein
MFVEKSLEEISKMSFEEQTAYMTEKKAHESEVRKLEIEKAIADAQEKNVEKAVVEKLEAELKTLKDAIIEQGLTIKANSEKPAMEKGYATIDEALTKALEGQAEEIAKAIAGNQREAIKAVVTMQVDNTIGAGATQVTITDNTGIITETRRRETTYLANVSVGRTSGNRALWIEQTDEDGTPIMLGEGDPKTQLSAQWEEKTAGVKKIAVYGKVTTELMADIPQLVSYIKNNLMKRLDISLEDQYFNGDGLGDNLIGANSLATAFSAGALALSIPDANDYDVVRAVALQTQLAFGTPNAIFVNPSVVARMQLTKDSTGQYLMPTFFTLDGLKVSGMKVIPTTAITGENFIGGDLSVLNVLIREELGIQIGLDGNDFTNNKKTMLLEKRVVQFASANDVACLVKGAFDTAKTALLLP